MYLPGNDYTYISTNQVQQIIFSDTQINNLELFSLSNTHTYTHTHNFNIKHQHTGHRIFLYF